MGKRKARKKEIQQIAASWAGARHHDEALQL
jgi:hypothetical protein